MVDVFDVFDAEDTEVEDGIEAGVRARGALEELPQQQLPLLLLLGRVVEVLVEVAVKPATTYSNDDEEATPAP